MFSSLFHKFSIDELSLSHKPLEQKQLSLTSAHGGIINYNLMPAKRCLLTWWEGKDLCKYVT